LAQGLPEPAGEPTGQLGAALVLVLWVLALVTVLILAFLGGADTALHIARNDDAAAQAQALAESGVTLAILALSDPAPATRWQADGSAHRVSFGGGVVEVSVQDENGKVDLNVAPPALFIGLFRTLGAGDDAATTIASSIIDWRSGNTGGAADNGAVPAPQQFLDVSEFAQLPGVSHELFRAAAPYLTVYSFSPYINPMTAPDAVLRSLPGVNEAAIGSFLASRAQSAGDATTAGQVPAAGDIAVSPVSTVTITARAQMADGRYTREAVVSLTVRPGTPFLSLAWGQPRNDTAATSAP
jgi:general secretion pathway protein K